MRRALSVLLLLCLLLSASARAEAETLAGSITVELRCHGTWQSIPLHLRYAHEGGRLADGILMFMPLAEYAAYRGEAIPRLCAAEDFACRISTTDYPESFSCTRVLRRQEGDQLTVLEAEGLSPSELEPGLYLLAWDVTVQRGSEAYSGTALAWLHVE